MDLSTLAAASSHFPVIYVTLQVNFSGQVSLGLGQGEDVSSAFLPGSHQGFRPDPQTEGFLPPRADQHPTN